MCVELCIFCERARTFVIDSDPEGLREIVKVVKASFGSGADEESVCACSRA